MLKSLRKSWAFKLFLALISVILLTALIHTIAMNLSIQSTFDRHVGRMNPGMQNMMGNMRGSTLYTSFRAAVNESMLISLLAAVLIAIPVSLLLSRFITRPVKALTEASRYIAQGEYSHRVPVSSAADDELGQLAQSFNSMAEKLELTEQMRRQLIGDISHELRTPLTAIKGSMEALMDGVMPADQATYTQVFREADRLQRLVEDLQELSRVEAGQFSLQRKSLHIETLARAAVNNMEAAFAKKGVALNLQTESRLPKVSADPDRMLQVFHNLLGNALQFTPEGGSVQVSIEKAGAEIRCSVTDTGAGIEARHLAHIFERFYRADPSRSRAGGGGSGIGLTISKTLVEAHGGRIEAASEGRGKGSQFMFTMPV